MNSNFSVPLTGTKKLGDTRALAWRTRAAAACERRLSGLFVPPRLLGVSPAALVGRKNPSKFASSQVQRSFRGADLG